MTRANNFDGLRLVAALMVLVSHQMHVVGLQQPRLIGGHSLGNTGVLIFFSISGFLIAGSLAADPDPFRFLARRLLRLVPGLVVAYAVAWLFVPWMRYGPFNGPSWTLPYEFYCYAALLLASLLLKGRAAMYMTATFVALWTLNQEAPGEVFTLYFGLFFCVGACMQRYPLLQRTPVVLASIVSGLALLWAGWLSDVPCLALIVAPAVIWIGTRSFQLLRDAARRGDLSYGIYLYHWPVMNMLVRAGTDIRVIVPTLIITIACAWLSWRFVEAPALRLKPTKQHGVARQANGRIDIRYERYL